jgi:hypothetical protein
MENELIYYRGKRLIPSNKLCYFLGQCRVKWKRCYNLGNAKELRSVYNPEELSTPTVDYPISNAQFNF